MADVPVGFERFEPGSPWGDVVYADGDRLPVEDPDGEIESETLAVASKYRSQVFLPEPEPVTAPQDSFTGASGGPSPQSASIPTTKPRKPTLGADSPASGAPGTPGAGGTPMNPAQQLLEQSGLSPAAQQAQASLAPAPAPGGSPAEPPREMLGPPAETPSADANPAAALAAEQGLQPSGPASPFAAGVQAAEGAGLKLAGVTVSQRGQEQAALNQETRSAIDTATQLKEEAVLDRTSAMAGNLLDQMEASRQGELDGIQAARQAEVEQATRQKIADAAAAKMQKVADEVPPKLIEETPGWFVALSVIASAAGGFAEAASGGRVPNQIPKMLNQLAREQAEEFKNTQQSKFNALKVQLGSEERALGHLASVAKEGYARAAEERKRYASTKNEFDLLSAVAGDQLAQVYQDRAKSLGAIKADESLRLSYAEPKPVAGAGAGKAKLGFEGLPEQARFVGEELQKFAERNGIPPGQARTKWAEYTKKFEDIAPAVTAVSDAKAIIEPYRQSGDVPGKGPFGNMPPNWMTSDEGVAVRQKLGFALQKFVRAESGAQVTDNERAFLNGIIEGSGSFDDIHRGLNILQRVQRETEKTIDDHNPQFAFIRQGSQRLGAKARSSDVVANAVREGEDPAKARERRDAEAARRSVEESKSSVRRGLGGRGPSGIGGIRN